MIIQIFRNRVLIFMIMVKREKTYLNINQSRNGCLDDLDDLDDLDHLDDLNDFLIN